MWLAERATQGTPVPTTLPSDLIPPPSASDHVFKGQNSFEDKRKENFERGRMELERRKREIKEKQEREKVSGMAVTSVGMRCCCVGHIRQSRSVLGWKRLKRSREHGKCCVCITC